MSSSVLAARIEKVSQSSSAGTPNGGHLLGFDASFDDLYRRDGLARLDAAFVAFLKGADASLHHRLMAARAAPDAISSKDESEFVIDLAAS